MRLTFWKGVEVFCHFVFFVLIPDPLSMAFWEHWIRRALCFKGFVVFAGMIQCRWFSGILEESDCNGIFCVFRLKALAHGHPGGLTSFS